MERVVSKSEKGRFEYIDTVKEIFLVLIGHTVDSYTICKNVLYSFHMPQFFFLSGMVIEKQTIELNLSGFHFCKKIFKLLLPYLIWGIDIAFMAAAFIIFGYLIRPTIDVLVRIKLLYTGIF